MKRTKNRSNIDSPSSIKAKCDLDDLQAWVLNEARAVENASVRDVVVKVAANIDDFVRWPKEALLLWEGRSRNEKYHRYPPPLIELSKSAAIRRDGRANGPAILAFRAAAGDRPSRFGSKNSWSVHHIYSGKFPYLESHETLHAAYHDRHFTQSAGLVATHPIADQLCDEFPFFSWLLRAYAYKKFAYDPDHVFARCGHDDYGFVAPSGCQVKHKE